MTKSGSLKFLIQLIRLGFRRFPVLYFLTVLSIFSILLETIAMSLLGSLSGRKFIVFNDLLKDVDSNLIFIPVILFLVIRFASMYYIETRYAYIARQLQTYLSSRTLLKIFNEDLKIIEQKEIGFFISMAGDEASRSSEILNSFMRILNAVIIGGLYFLMILYFDINFIYVLLIFFLINFLVIQSMMKKLAHLGAEGIVANRSATSIFMDSLNSLRTVKSFGMGAFIYDKYSQVMDKYQMINYKIFAISLFNRLFPLISLFLLFDAYVAYDYLTTHQLTITYLLSIFFILMRFLTIVGELLQTGSTVFSNLKLTNDIVSFSEHLEESTSSIALDKIETIRMASVSFGHIANQSIFANLNLTFERGKSYIIMGRTGTGKSTLLDLIMDFNTPNLGDIYVNNVNSKDIDEKSFTNKILYISQESIVFNSTIKENLELDKTYPDEKISHSLAVAELASTLETFEGKLSYRLNYRGTNISGGQKQRLNIARALLREPDVLILDESVNALDSETRIKVIRNIIAEFKDKIFIIVSHDKEIIDLVDIIVDLDQIKLKNE